MLKLLVAALVFSAPPGVPAEPAVMYRQGADLASSARYDEAAAVFKSLVDISPNYTLAHYGYGRCCLYTGKTEEAVYHLSICVKLDRTLAKGHFHLGMAYLRYGKKIRAIHSFKRAYELDSSFSASLFNIGAVYDSTGDSYKAGKYFAMFNGTR